MFTSKKIYLCISLSLVLGLGFKTSSEKKYVIRTIAFYNLENLFDTINDSDTKDEESPIMKLKEGRSKVYKDKIKKLASVISQIGEQKTHTSPAIIGLAEVENRSVLEDLVNSEELRSKNYEIIHYDSPDRRGIDVALLYQPSYFNPIFHESFNPNLYRQGKKVHTRDQLLVSGYLDDELIHIIVNHWPSRRGGEERTRALRERSAYQNMKMLKEIKENDVNPKVLIMGDFNDNPTDSSLKKVLKTKSRRKDLKSGDLYNPYEQMFKRGLNSGGFRDNISLFDQIIVTKTLVNKDKNDFATYKMFKAGIFNKNYLTTKKGQYKGYPFRSFSSENYTGGYSDHYPVYIYLIRHK